MINTFRTRHLSPYEKAARTRKANRKAMKAKRTLALLVIMAISLAVYDAAIKSLLSDFEPLPVQASQIEPDKPMQEWVFNQWEEAYGLDIAIKMASVIQCESNWNTESINYRSNDYGLYQFNKVHLPKRLLPSCSLDYKCATEKALDLYDEQGFTPWVCARTLGIR